MNERWVRNQESYFPRFREFHTASPITFKELGIMDLREKRLSLDNEPVIVMSVKDSENKSTNHFAFYDHPFVGAHLAHFLNAEAPIKVDPSYAKEAILADFGMPIRATRPTDNDLAYEEDKRLHEFHQGNPDIERHYMEFVEQGLDIEIPALKNPKYDNLFNQTMLLKVINSKAVEGAYRDFMTDYKSEGFWGNTSLGTYRYIQKKPIEKRYTDFLFRQPEYKLNHYASLDIQIKYIIPRFLEHLDLAGQKELFITQEVFFGCTVIDPAINKVFGNLETDVDLSFSNNTAEVADHNGNNIEIEFQNDSEELFFPNASVRRYNFSEELKKNALFAVIAWNKTQDGQRRFLSQNELLDSFPLLNLYWAERIDAYLGRNLLGYFSKEITDEWPSEISLEGHPRAQRMMGAQMSVRDSLDSDKYPHARQLLAGSVIQKLEAHALAP